MIVTSFGPAGYGQYGKRFIESFLEHWPDERLVVYVEEPMPDDYGERVEVRDLFSIEHIKQNLDTLRDSDPIYQGRMLVQDKPTYNYRFDAYRFMRKVYAMYDAGSNATDRYMAWIDADVVFRKDVPEGFLPRQLPPGCFTAYLGRPMHHSETGFIVFDLEQDYAGTFFTLFRDMYRTGAFRHLGEWHDCYVYDTIRELMQVPSNDMVGHIQGITHGHPFVEAEIGQYADHLKGPDRKKAGKSKESKING